MRIAIVGAGGRLRGAAILWQFLMEEKLTGVNFVLIDPDDDAVSRLALVGKKMAEKSGLRVSFTPRRHFDRAFDAADAVINLACIQRQKSFLVDQSIIASFDPSHVLTEWGGLHGLSFSLRQMALAHEIAGEVVATAPDAWLLNLAGPLPRVCAAAHQAGANVVGLSDAPFLAQARIAQALGAEPENLAIQAAGTPRLAWATEILDRSTGQDLYPGVREALAQGEPDLVSETLAKTGWLPLAPANQLRDFFPLAEGEQSIDPWNQAETGEREFRQTLMDWIIDGEEEVEALGDSPLRMPVAGVTLALLGLKPGAFLGVSSPNLGQVPELPNGVFVESPGQLGPEGLVPEEVSLPASVREVANRTAEIHRLFAQAFRNKRLAPLREAIALDPTILDKSAAEAALPTLVGAHSDLIGRYQ